jgi:signal transduction histidine kinase
MRKSLIIVTVIFTFFLNQISGINSEINTNRNILILFSFTPTTPAYRPILEGIRQKLSDEFHDSYNLHLEYLETEKYPRGKYPREVFDLYNKKYQDVNLDLLICIGVDIISAVKNNADDHLKNLPSITIDFDFSEYDIPFEMSLNNKTTVIGLKLKVGQTISEALKILPRTSSIYFICGSSRVDSLYMRISKEESKKIGNRINITFLTDMSMDEVLKRVKTLPENSLVFVAGFNKDKDKIPYYNTESIRLISNSANSPVFSYSDMGFGEGAFGGEILSFKKVGQLAGKTALQILNGTDPESIKIVDQDYYEYLLDWRELVKWKLTGLVKTKKESTVFYREVTFFMKYKWLLISGLIFLFLQSFLIAALIQMNRRQKKMTRRIVETDRLYRDILREDRLLRIGLLTISLSHELNQPLTSILSTAQAGKRFLETNNNDPELLKEILNNIVEADNRASSILKSIRGLMKQEKREKEEVNLNKLLIEISDLYRSKAIELNSKLNLKLTDSPVFIFADAIQIQQVILNFISNAAQSLDNNGKDVNIITVTETLEDEHVIVSVRDYGKGIDETVKGKLFEPFVTSRKEGTGVGLAICRLIIEDHHGKIWAENLPDRGAVFSFKLKVNNDTES